jgi:glycosyltransferase involved in cell wall biosynthesis
MNDLERPPGDGLPKVLILTPVKDVGPGHNVDKYFAGLRALTYPAGLLSIGILESDSQDGTYALFHSACQAMRPHFRRIQLWQKHFGFRIPAGMPRWDPRIQFQRRTVLARSRNHLLFRALDDEDWVLWLDADVVEYPPDIIEQLISYDRDIIQPHCVKQYGGPTFDLNAWRDHARLHMHDLRSEGELVRLDAVGGTMLLVRADCHRDGLVFPPFLYGRRNPKVRVRGDILMPNDAGEIETEGLGIMASDMDFECWGLPNVEIIHASS